ncbi:phosphopantetheine-containing protein [Rahnella sp. C60]|jgi:acyl carrier protein|uniref:Phosphopantetheine-containing protein n=1 Tax=Rahnella perminowiae TaxID=2816244 RepID=A0ABS6L4L0_9GAMM|nr:MULTISPECIES: phosphopantetheine-binding protein [Rahnella]UJD92043.1 phosphopantetheine-containing protein [Rahnella aquatilis]MBU9809164.1 phosphopantetheine-containing protein [Rahnella perminowiae]MBU9815352.1 phosphopantetheine-containing protein [Rahnella perminowiae]MBU9825184.1 phosphopantetheine-containing protein [Rahnella perminowiae]MBU9836340.1 phosphopantetheine-containing protein [Rahnella perminowiae]
MFTSTIIEAIGLVLESSHLSELHAETHLERDLGFESGLYIELIMYLEEKIDGLILDPATLEFEHFETVGSLSNFIQLQLANRAA